MAYHVIKTEPDGSVANKYDLKREYPAALAHRMVDWALRGSHPAGTTFTVQQVDNGKVVRRETIGSGHLFHARPKRDKATGRYYYEDGQEGW